MTTSPTVLLRAAWLAPIDAPLIRDGAVVFSGERIEAVGDAARLIHEYPDAVVEDAGEAVLLPGLVNAHVHLELTRFTRRPVPAGGFVGWILELRERAIAAAAATGGEEDAATTASVEAGVAQCLRFGVTCVGDIGYRAPLVRGVLGASPLRGVSFGEVLGMAGRAAQFGGLLTAAVDKAWERPGLRSGIEPHAPYSVDLSGYRRCVEEAARGGFPIATHLAETPDEGEFLANHAGPFRDLWEALDAWGPGVSRFADGPIRAMRAVGLLDLPALLAHGNYVDDNELDVLAAGRASVVYCPRTHAYFHHAPHRWREMLARGINVALGTDSCASAPDLNLVDDLRLVHRFAPEVDAFTLWEMATSRAARALGMGAEVGTLAADKWADCVAFPVAGDDPLTHVLEGERTPSQVWIGGKRMPQIS